MSAPSASHSTRWQHRLRQSALWLALFGAAGCTIAHDWVSPAAATTPSRPSPLVAEAHAPWTGLIWRGPASGAPAAPAARDCRRLPQPIDLAGPNIPMPQTSLRRTPMIAPGAPRPEPATAAKAAEGMRAAIPPIVADAAPPPPAPVPAPAPPPALLGESRAPIAPTAPTQGSSIGQPARPASEPVTAGVVDDNADFGEYLAYRGRKSNLRVRVRDRDISERYKLTVHDSNGRVVPDAQVTLWSGGQPRPLWARTDAGGQVWLHPRAAGIDDGRLEVRVQKASGAGELRGSALLRRGQRDALQVRLDGPAAAERARLDLVFLIDATGSMGDEIDKLKRSMNAVAQQIAALPSQPDVCYSLVAYRDRGDEFFVRAWDFTDDLGSFQQALGGLRAGGGGDYPEALNEALHTAVHRLSWRGDGTTRLVLLVADAPPQLGYGTPFYDDDMQGALARGIKLFGIAASGLDPSGEYIFRQMAQYTGGRFVFLTYDKATHPASGPGRETVHDVGNYSVETLDRLVVRLVREELARRPS